MRRRRTGRDRPFATILPVSHFLLNPAARQREHRGLFTSEEYAEVRAFYSARQSSEATPLASLPQLARRLKVRDLLIKDESTRFGMHAFKILGVRYAVAQLRASGGLVPGATLVCASAGNHGRAVARVARENGLRARVYLSHTAAPARVQAIESEGAETALVTGTYDDAVRVAAEDAGREGWTVISDTAWPGYEQIPRWIMAGYTWMLDECSRQWQQAPDVVIIQAGVGGLACAVASWLAFHLAGNRPFLIVCEPDNAACVMESVRAGRAAKLGSNVDSAMAGLACGEPSSLTWPVLAECADAFVTVDDSAAQEAMRTLAHPAAPDAQIVAGASGASGLAALTRILADPALGDLRRVAQFSASTRVLLFNTEGATDPEHWNLTTGTWKRSRPAG